MTRVVAGGFVLVLFIETAAFLFEPRLALPAAGVAVAGFAMVLTGRFAADGPTDTHAADAAAESLQRWRSQTETLIARADSTRGAWDRHLRPRLALEFMLATNRRDPGELEATGRMVFGEELWQWVDPRNVTRTGRDVPGPGRDALEEILRRLESL